MRRFEEKENLAARLEEHAVTQNSGIFAIVIF